MKPEIPPVIFVVYRRPDLTKEALAAIAAARPSRMFIVADGPKNEDEAVLCQEVLEVVREGVTWDCDVQWNVAESNMGLANRVGSGISWAFTQCDYAIVLEDDCIPVPGFFPWMAEMLERYRNESRVMVVTGDNFQNGVQRGDASYYFSAFPHCWGWATWADRWETYRKSPEWWASDGVQDRVLEWASGEASRKYWFRCFDLAYSGQIDSWAFRWQASIWYQKGLTVVPQVNLVENVGFGEGATNTQRTERATGVVGGVLEFPLRHPERIERMKEADKYTEDNHFRIGVAKVNRGNKKPSRKKGNRKEPKNTISRKFRQLFGDAPKGAVPVLQDEKNRLESLPRRQRGSTSIIKGKEIQFVDPASFLSAYGEIWERKCLDLGDFDRSLYVIDGGANIGLASLYLGEKYPGSEILSFEPDPEVFEVLQQNVGQCENSSIDCHKLGLAGTECVREFFQEGADGGGFYSSASGGDRVEVKCDILSKYLDRPVDLLKLDIEGAEYEVLCEAEELLQNVNCIFLEYHKFDDTSAALSSTIALLERSGFELYVESGRNIRKPYRHLRKDHSPKMLVNIFGERVS